MRTIGDEDSNWVLLLFAFPYPVHLYSYLATKSFSITVVIHDDKFSYTSVAVISGTVICGSCCCSMVVEVAQLCLVVEYLAL
jgi:hypothetical protein